MSYSAKVILDSLSPIGSRLTTMEVCFPRFILAEMNTHRDFSRNSASSRAVPVHKMLDLVMTEPVIPSFGKNQPGMQAVGIVEDEMAALNVWLRARNLAVAEARTLSELGVHKQVVNRLLEPFLWHTCIISSTRWENFFEQRCDPAAQPEMQVIAGMMRSAIRNSVPTELERGAWHLPYVQDEERVRFPRHDLKRLSVARCARVSYLNHDGVRDFDADMNLYDKLIIGMHWSPFEHVAMATSNPDTTPFNGNFSPGWHQLRKLFPGEYRRG